MHILELDEQQPYTQDYLCIATGTSFSFFGNQSRLAALEAMIAM